MNPVQKKVQENTRKPSKITKRKNTAGFTKKLFSSGLEELKSFQGGIFLNLGTMEQNRPYKITKAARRETKFGERILLELDYNQQIYLPERYKGLSENVIKEMNEERYSITNSGAEGKSYILNFNPTQADEEINHLEESAESTQFNGQFDIYSQNKLANFYNDFTV